MKIASDCLTVNSDWAAAPTIRNRAASQDEIEDYKIGTGLLNNEELDDRRSEKPKQTIKLLQEFLAINDDFSENSFDETDL